MPNKWGSPTCDCQKFCDGPQHSDSVELFEEITCFHVGSDIKTQKKAATKGKTDKEKAKEKWDAKAQAVFKKKEQQDPKEKGDKKGKKK